MGPGGEDPSLPPVSPAMGGTYRGQLWYGRDSDDSLRDVERMKKAMARWEGHFGLKHDIIQLRDKL